MAGKIRRNTKKAEKKATVSSKKQNIAPSPAFSSHPDSSEQDYAPAELKVVGKNVPKVDAVGLALGTAKFVEDIEPMKDLLYGKILTSPHAHARIKSIDVSKALALEGVECVLTYRDLPRIAHTTAGQGFPEPSPYDTFTLDSKVRYVGDRVAAVAARTREIAEEACKLIRVDYEVLPAVLDPEHAQDKGAPVIHDEKEARMIIPLFYDKKHNVVAKVPVDIGNVEKGLQEADVVVDRVFRTHYAQHCPIEPHVTMTWLDEQGRLVIRSSTQVPFHVRRIVAQALQIPVKKIRVIKPRIGGGFGAKQEVLLEDICSALTLKTGKPVLLAYTRKDEFMSSRTRHPSVIRVRAGARKTGEITALHVNVLLNTGAYGSHGLTVLTNCGSKVLPLYRTPNVRFEGTTVYTNLPVAGAYRGYGATQTAFPVECAMDELAKSIGMDPVEFRKINHIRTGETSPIFAKMGEGTEGVEQTIGSCELDACLEQGARAFGWGKPFKREEGPLRIGRGMCILMQGSSIPEIDMATVSLKLNEDGSFNLHAGATDLGTGSDTVLAQIAAEVLGVKASDIIVYSSDTDLTPFDVGAYASSTTYLSGMAAKKAAAKAKEQIMEVASKILGVPADEIILEGGKAFHKNNLKKSVTLSEIANYSLYRKNQFQIHGYASAISHKSPPPFAAHFAEVAVDIETGQVKVRKYVAAVDCGQAINPQLAHGQTHGAILNGISYALTERYIFDENGRMLNPGFNYYKIFSSLDAPEIISILVESHEPTGPFGAKSISEISINGPLPSISNAIFDAVGIRLTESPFTPDRVLAAIKARGQ